MVIYKNEIYIAGNKYFSGISIFKNWKMNFMNSYFLIFCDSFNSTKLNTQQHLKSQ